MAFLEKVRKTGERSAGDALRTSGSGISAPGSGLRPVRKFGTMAGTMQIVGDIVGPISDIRARKRLENEAAARRALQEAPLTWDVAAEMPFRRFMHRAMGYRFLVATAKR